MFAKQMFAQLRTGFQDGKDYKCINNMCYPLVQCIYIIFGDGQPTSTFIQLLAKLSELNLSDLCLCSSLSFILSQSPYNIKGRVT